MLTHERLLELLHYDPDTGHFIWLVDRSSGVKKGDIAGSMIHTDENKTYWRIRVDNEQYYAHRLAFFYMTKRWPIPTCDHENLDSLDNRWGNLREASISEQGYNKKAYGESGHKGVTWNKRLNKWQVWVGKYIGVFADFEMACLIADEHRDAMHGKFARHT